MAAAIAAILADPEPGGAALDGLIGPAHVSTVIGSRVSAGRSGSSRRQPLPSRTQPPHSAGFSDSRIGSSKSFLAT